MPDEKLKDLRDCVGNEIAWDIGCKTYSGRLCFMPNPHSADGFYYIDEHKTTIELGGYAISTSLPIICSENSAHFRGVNPEGEIVDRRLAA